MSHLPFLPEPIPELVPTPIETLKVMRPEEWQTKWPWPYRVKSFREGCYLIRFTPLPKSIKLSVHYDGTLRIEKDGTNIIASGDLYVHQLTPWGPFLREPDPARGIPIFARSRYRYYLRITQILLAPAFLNSVTIEFELHRYNQNPTTLTWSWTNEGTFKAVMTWTTAPSGYPDSSQYLTGEVKNSLGNVVGNVTMGWVSSYLRRAIIEIDKVSASEWPLDNGAGVDWRTIYDLVGWDVTVVQSDSSVPEPSGESWSDAELHQEMLAWRDSANLETAWRYHVMCVRRLDSTDRGIMYDNNGTDSNNISREGCAISSHWMIPNTSTWGAVAGMRFGTATGPYFRTAVHETGHAHLLYHNTVDMGIMNTTNVIAASAVPPVQFPDNIQWSHAPDDQKRLRHMPDIWVRPGGIPWNTPTPAYATTPISPGDMIADAEGLELQVSPLLETVPIGAPVRVEFTIVNKSDTPLTVPASLSIKTGHVQGKVIDPSGTERTFSPIIRCIDEERLQMLEPGKNMGYSLTLLRGAQGSLFPSPGVHRIIVEVTWEVEGVLMRLAGETTVMIMPPIDEAHAKAARKILSTPDALLVLAIGGDHLKNGILALRAGLDNPILRPHFSFIEAKRLGKRFGKRKADIKAVAKLLDKKTVMSSAEIKRAAELVQGFGKGAPNEIVKQIAKTLESKISRVTANDEIVKMVKSL